MRDLAPGSDVAFGARTFWETAADAGPFASLGPIGMLGSFTAQSRSLVMAFLVRLRIFPDQPARGPLACCGRSADAFG
ncbi:hypothetical protein LCM4577_22960 [Mesorhizobium sp. LCM 4577]|nr:hypothetical protein LCM4577_22960 [Mesorhizobium sp. LCM 4577]